MPRGRAEIEDFVITRERSSLGRLLEKGGLAPAISEIDQMNFETFRDISIEDGENRFMYRRRLLAAGGTAMVAGCTNPLSEDPKVAIGSIIYRNDTDDERTVQLLLRRLDENEDRGFDVVYDERVMVPGTSVDIVEADWTTEPHEYELLYATADELNMLRVPKDVSAYIDEDGCNHIMAQFSEPDGLTMWVSNDLPIDDELPSC